MKSLIDKVVDEKFLLTVIHAIESGEWGFGEDQEEKGFPTHNGASACCWNFVNGELKKRLPSDIYSCTVRKVGCWEFLLIYSRKTNITYALTKEGNLRRLQKNPEKYPVHYLAALASLNKELKREGLERNMEQQSLWEEDLSHEDLRISKRDRLIENVGIIEAFALVVFATRDATVQSIRLILPTEHFGYWWQRNCNQFIRVSYIDETGKVKKEQTKADVLISSAPEVMLRRKKLPTASEKRS